MRIAWLLNLTDPRSWEPRFVPRLFWESWFLVLGSRRFHQNGARFKKRPHPQGTKIHPKTFLGILVLGSWFQAFLLKRGQF